MAWLRIEVGPASSEALERLRGQRPPWARINAVDGRGLLRISLQPIGEEEEGGRTAQLAAASFAAEPEGAGWNVYLASSDLLWALAGIALLAGGFERLEASGEGREALERARAYLEQLPFAEEGSVDAYAESGWLYLSCPFGANARAKALGWYRWDPDRREWRYPDTPVQRALLNRAFPALRLPPEEAANRQPRSARMLPQTAAPREGLEPAALQELGDLFSRAIGPVIEELRQLRSEVERLRAFVEETGGLVSLASPRPGPQEQPSEAPAIGAPPGSWEELLEALAGEPDAAAERARALLGVSPSNELRAVLALAEERREHWQESLRVLAPVPSTGFPRRLATAVDELRRRLVERTFRHLAQLDSGDSEVLDVLLEELRAGDLRGRLRADQAGELLPAAAQVASGVPELHSKVQTFSLVVRLLRGDPNAVDEALGRAAELEPGAESACLLAAAAVGTTSIRSLAGLGEWWPDDEGPRAEDERVALLERAAAQLRTGRAKQAPWFPVAALSWLALAAPYESSQALLRLRRYFSSNLHGDEALVGQYLAAWAGALRAEHGLSPGHYRGLLDALERQVSADRGRWFAVRRYLSIMAKESSPEWQQAVAGGEESLLLRLLRDIGLREPGDFQVAFDLLYAGDRNARGLLQLADWLLGREIAGAELLPRDEIQILLEACLERASQSQEAVRAFHLLYQFRLEYDDADVDAWLQEQSSQSSRGPVEKRFRAQVAYVERALSRDPGPDEAATAIQMLAPFLESAATAARLAPLLTEAVGLARAFPQYRPQFEEIGLLRAALERIEAEGERPSRPLRLFIAGGHQQMRRHAQPLLEERGHTVRWLTADEVARGEQALALAKGNCDLVVIVTGYISHAASERVRRAAEAAGTEVADVHSTGVGSLLLAVDERAGRSAA